MVFKLHCSKPPATAFRLPSQGNSRAGLACWSQCGHRALKGFVLFVLWGGVGGSDSGKTTTFHTWGCLYWIYDQIQKSPPKTPRKHPAKSRKTPTKSRKRPQIQKTGFFQFFGNWKSPNFSTNCKILFKIRVRMHTNGSQLSMGANFAQKGVR